MKKMFVLFCLFFFSSLAGNGKVWTVSNDSLNFPAQYYNLQNVIDNIASGGDTIMIAGTSTVLGNKSYVTITIKKPLTIIGRACALNNRIKNKTYIEKFWIDTIGITITGCEVVYFESHPEKNHTNLQIKRNNITYISLGIGDSVLIFNNYIASVYMNNNKNVIISNNIIWSTGVQKSDKNTVLITNNIIGGGGYEIAYQIKNATFTNNIFFKAKRQYNSNDPALSIFNNNLTYSCLTTIQFLLEVILGIIILLEWTRNLKGGMRVNFILVQDYGKKILI